MLKGDSSQIIPIIFCTLSNHHNNLLQPLNRAIWFIKQCAYIILVEEMLCPYQRAPLHRVGACALSLMIQDACIALTKEAQLPQSFMVGWKSSYWPTLLLFLLLWAFLIFACMGICPQSVPELPQEGLAIMVGQDSSTNFKSVWWWVCSTVDNTQMCLKIAW